MKRTHSRSPSSKQTIDLKTKPKAKIKPIAKTNLESTPRSKRKESAAKTNALQKTKVEPNLKFSNVDTLTIKNIHAMTKELIATLYTIEKSLVLITQLTSLLDNYNINLKQLNSRELSSVLKKFNYSQLEKAVQLFQKPEILGLLKTLSNAVESGTTDPAK